MTARTYACIVLSLASLLPLVAGGCAPDISRRQAAARIGQPRGSGPFFGDQVLYMGDCDGYRYLHVRSIHSYLGDRDFKVADAQWPMTHPMKYSENPLHWRDVTWMNGDADGFPQNAFLYLTPTFPEGAPATRPFAAAPIQQFDFPQTQPEASPGAATAPATAPASRPAMPITQPSPASGPAGPG